MIEINVAQLLKQQTGAVRHVEIDELDEGLAVELRLLSPTTGSLRLLRTPSGILVTGALSHQQEATCCRCLESFVRTQALELEEEFLPVLDVSTGLPLARPEDPEAFLLTSNHLLQLDEAIRQYAILEEPIQPLCRTDCQGLCVECGANLNLGPCKCQSAPEGAPQGAFGALLAERMRQAGFKTE